MALLPLLPNITIKHISGISKTKGHRVRFRHVTLPSCVADEEYGDSKPKKVRTVPREPKRSKNSQDDR